MIHIKNLKNKTEQEINAAFPHNDDRKYYVFLVPNSYAQQYEYESNIHYFQDIRFV